jgi:streptogramin lyase
MHSTPRQMFESAAARLHTLAKTEKLEGFSLRVVAILLVSSAASSGQVVGGPVSNSGFRGPISITSGPDGNLWFTEAFGQTGRITTSGVISELPGGGGSSITRGPDGNLWFTVPQGNEIVRITTAGVLTEFFLPSFNTLPSTITSGPDGNLWFTESEGNKIGRITTSGVITEFALPSGPPPPVCVSTCTFGFGGITSGPDANLWFADLSTGRTEIGRISTSGVFAEFPLSGTPYRIASGPDGNLWFADTSGSIGRITTSGVIAEFAIPTSDSGPRGITVGPDGNLWFTEYTGNKIGRITTSGVVTEVPIPTTNSAPFEITTGPDGNLWFTEYSGNKIGRITPSGMITEFALAAPAPVPALSVPALSPLFLALCAILLAGLGGWALLAGPAEP